MPVFTAYRQVWVAWQASYLNQVKVYLPGSSTISCTTQFMIPLVRTKPERISRILTHSREHQFTLQSLNLLKPSKGTFYFRGHGHSPKDLRPPTSKGAQSVRGSTAEIGKF